MQTKESVFEVNLKAADSAEMVLHEPRQFLQKSRVFQLIKYLGPAFVVSVAYIDPSNNILRHHGKG